MLAIDRTPNPQAFQNVLVGTGAMESAMALLPLMLSCRAQRECTELVS